jgi:hypothetical protein
VINCLSVIDSFWILVFLFFLEPHLVNCNNFLVRCWINPNDLDLDSILLAFGLAFWEHAFHYFPGVEAFWLQAIHYQMKKTEDPFSFWFIAAAFWAVFLEVFSYEESTTEQIFILTS